MRSRLLLGLLLFIICVTCAWAASATEVSIGNSEPGAAWFHRATPVVASNGRGFLTAWLDYRNGGSEIFAMRVALDGTPIDRVAFRVARPRPERLINSISIASDGVGYLIAYTESQPLPQVVRFAHVDDQGVVTIRDLIPHAADVSIAWSGSSYVASYRDESMNYAAVVDRDGTVLRERTPLIGGGAWAFRVGGGANGRVIGTWLTDNSAVVAAPIDSAALLDGKFAPLASISTLPGLYFAQPPVVASSDRGHLVVWAEVTGDSVITTIRARRLDATGAPIGNPFTIAEARSTYINVIAATWTGSSYLVAYVDIRTGRVRTMSVTDNGFTAMTDLTGDYDDVEVALATAAHGETFVAWSRETARRTIHGAMLDAISEPHLLSVSTPAQSDPRLTPCGDGNFAGAWVESSDLQRVVVDRFGSNGMRTHEGGARLVSSDNLQTLPAVACNSTSALVAWSDSDRRANTFAFAQLVDLPERTLRPAIPLGHAMPGQRPAVVRTGNQYVVAWQSFESRQLVVARINREGQLIDTRTLRTSNGDSYPSLAWNGSEILLTWLAENSQLFPDTTVAIPLQRAQAMRLSPELTPLGSIVNLSFIGDGDDARTPIASAGTNAWLVTWRQRVNWFTPYELHTALIGRDGQLIHNRFLYSLPYDVAFDTGGFGDEFRVVFAKTMIRIAANGSEVIEDLATTSDSATGIAHGQTPFVVYSKTSDDESVPRLFIDANPAPRRRAVR